MLLLNCEKAYIPREKIELYLLSQTHAIGKSKAKFFRAMGYNEANADLLEQGLLTIGRTQEVVDMVSSTHGVKYVIDGFLQTPNGKFVTVRTIWIIEAGNASPRFVTAYPSKKWAIRYD